MAKKAVAVIEIGEGGTSVSPFSQVVIIQRLFGHHEFEIHAPLNSIEGTGGNVLKKSKDLVGKLVKISFESELIKDSQKQLFIGLITEIGLSRHQGGTSELVIRGKSPTRLLDDGLHCRSFSEKDIKSVVEDVFQSYPSNLIEKKIDPVFSDNIPYLVQYRESNFNFLYRIANIYGEWCFYNGSKWIFGKPEDGEPVKLNLGSDLFNFNLGMGVSQTNFQLHHYDYFKSEVLESKATDAKISALDEAYGKPAFQEAEALFAQAPQAPFYVPIKEKSELDKFAETIRTQQASGLVHVNGVSDNVGVSIGNKISISGRKSEDPKSGLEEYGSFFVTGITHRIDNNGNYQNHFEAVPSEVSMPPQNPFVRNPLAEPQPAVVKENHDPEGLGRVRVKFYWQKDPELTPWIRAVSPHGGASGGMFVIPEKNDEVIVAFEHHHPDKPFVMGSVYHGKAKPGGSWQDSNNNIKALKTKSGNEVLLIDEGGKESIKILNKGGENSITLTMEGGGKISISAKSSITFSAKEIMVNATDKYTLNSKEVTINATDKFKLDGKDADMQLSASSKIGSPKLDLQGHGGGKASTVTIQGNTIDNIADQFKADGSASATLSGKSVTVDAKTSLLAKGSSANLEASGITTIKGSNVKLN